MLSESGREKEKKQALVESKHMLYRRDCRGSARTILDERSKFHASIIGPFREQLVKSLARGS